MQRRCACSPRQSAQRRSFFAVVIAALLLCGNSDRHTQQIWLSPTGDTAFGAIRFRLPLPVGPRLLLGRFLAEMRRVEQSATLINKQDDPELPGIRFVAESD